MHVVKRVRVGTEVRGTVVSVIGEHRGVEMSGDVHAWVQWILTGQ